MILETSTDLVLSSERVFIKDEEVEVLHLADGKAVVLARNAVAVYRNPSAIGDELAQGLIDIAELPDALFDKQQAPSMIEHKAGFVGLSQGHVLLILPNSIKMYCTKGDALANRSPILTLRLDA